MILLVFLLRVNDGTEYLENFIGNVVENQIPSFMLCFFALIVLPEALLMSSCAHRRKMEELS